MKKIEKNDKKLNLSHDCIDKKSFLEFIEALRNASNNTVFIVMEHYKFVLEKLNEIVCNCTDSKEFDRLNKEIKASERRVKYCKKELSFRENNNINIIDEEIEEEELEK